MARRIGLSLLFGLVLVAAGSGVRSWLGGSRPAAVTGADVTYICLETGETFEGPVQSVPALNPETGRNTLVPAVYSTAKKAWLPAPPEEALRRHRRLMSQADGQSPLEHAAPEEN